MTLFVHTEITEETSWFQKSLRNLYGLHCLETESLVSFVVFMQET